MEGGKEKEKLKLANVPRHKPNACTTNTMIYHRPYQPLLSSSCQLGQPNGWLKCMCGHPRVKWRLWLQQKMDSCGRAYSLIQCNVIDMLLCFIISPPAPQHIAIALPNTDIWQMSSAAATQGDMKWFHFRVVWERDSSFKRPVFIHILEELFSFLRPRRPTKSYKLSPPVWICWIKCSDIHKVCDLGSAGGPGMFYFFLFSGPFRNPRYTGLTLRLSTLQYKKQLLPRYFWASFWG